MCWLPFAVLRERLDFSSDSSASDFSPLDNKAAALLTLTKSVDFVKDAHEEMEQVRARSSLSWSLESRWLTVMVVACSHLYIWWCVLGCRRMWPLLWPPEWFWGQLWQPQWWGWCSRPSKQPGLILVSGRSGAHSPVPCIGESIQSFPQENPDFSGWEWEEGSGGPAGWHRGYLWWDQPQVSVCHAWKQAHCGPSCCCSRFPSAFYILKNFKPKKNWKSTSVNSAISFFWVLLVIYFSCMFNFSINRYDMFFLNHLGHK